VQRVQVNDVRVTVSALTYQANTKPMLYQSQKASFHQVMVGAMLRRLGAAAGNRGCNPA